MIFLSGLALQGCKDEPPITPPIAEVEMGPGLEASDIEVYAGEIGVAIGTRKIARKGYLPVKATITVTGTHFNAAETIEINNLTQIAYFSRPLEELTEAEEGELRNQGVTIEIQVFDANDAELGRYNASPVFFSSDAIRMEVETLLEDLRLNQIHINSSVNHHVQIMDRQTKRAKYAVSSELAGDTARVKSLLMNLSELNYESGGNALVNSRYRFTKVPGKEGVFTISVHREGRVLYWYIAGASEVGVQNYRNWAINGGETNAADLLNYQFKIEAGERGLYTFRSLSTEQLLTLDGDHLRADVVAPDPDEIAYFRAINLDILWNFNTLQYKQMKPILPAARTEFAFNSTLINCSSGDLQQQVGREESKTTTLTSSWEESFSVSASASYSISTNSEASVTAGFFGGEVAYSQSVSTNFSVGVSATTSQSQAGSSSSSSSVTVSSLRTINVPSRKATLISDMYQTYRNIKIPYVQSFRIEGKYPNGGNDLSGMEILTQLNFNGFSGVVTEVQSTYVVLTVEGANFIDEMIQAQTVADDLPTDCD